MMQTNGAADARPSFSEWLLRRRDRGDWIDQLADAARRDPRFPQRGSVDQVRLHLMKAQVDGDVIPQLDDAELDYCCH